MAIPKDFEETNLRLLPPQGQEDQVIAINVFRGDGRIVSCWQLDADEIARIAETGEIWLSVWSGQTAPPVMVTARKEEVI